MLANPFLAVSFILNFVAILFIICCVVLILVILIQKGRGGGLSGAFGGAGAGSILGSKTGDFLTWVTIVLVGVFLLLAVVMAKFFKPAIGDYGTSTPARQTQPADANTGEAPSTIGDSNSAADAGASGG